MKSMKRPAARSVLCSLVFAALWLTGCEIPHVFDPKVTVTAETVLREAGPPLEFTVRVSPAPAKDLTFHVEMGAAGCVLPEQLRQARTVTIAAGDQEVTLTVRTDDIQIGADGCTVTVMVTEGDTGDESDSSDSRAQTLHVTVLITVPAPVPDPDPAVSVVAGASPVAEGTAVSFTLTATPAPAEPLTVAVRWSETGSFLTGTPPSQVTIPTSGTATVSASTEDDSADEADGTVTLTVGSGSGYAVGTPSSATVKVTDDDAAVVVRDPAVSVAAVTSPVTEGTDVSFTLTATPAPAAALTVAVRWSETGSFLTGARPETVTIPTTGTATVSASTEDDSNDEADGTVTLTVGSGSGYTVGTPSSAMVAVTDDDDAVVVPDPAVSVAAVTSPVTEGTDVSFTLTATPAPAAALTVAVRWSETGSFLTGTRPSEVTIPTSGKATVSASTEDDGADEADGTVTLTVTGGSGYTVGAPSSAVVTVTDDDVTPTVSVAADTSPVTEGTNVSFTLTATPAPAAPLTVAVSWSETGSFLTGTRPSEVTIPTSGEVRVTASTEDDGIDEADGTVTLTVGSGSGYTVGAPSSAVVTVTDDDVTPTVSVAAGTSPVTEGTNVSFTLTATPAPATPLTVAVSWSDPGSFLTGTRPSTVTISTLGTATVSASTEDDSIDEADGTVTLTVGSGSGYTVGTPSSADVRVTDDDVPAVSVEAVSLSVEEGGNVEFRLTATPEPAASLTVNVSWVHMDVNFSLPFSRPTHVTIPTSGTAMVSRSTQDDSIDEADGTVTLTVGSGSGYTVGTPDSAQVTVTDNDGGN